MATSISGVSQGLLYPRVPERLRVVVAWQVDDALPLRLPETPQRGEEVAILGTIHRQRGPILPRRHRAYLQEVEEVAGQDELDGPLMRPQLLEECLQLLRGLEAVASWI